MNRKIKLYKNILIAAVVCLFITQFAVLSLTADENAGKKASLWRDNSSFSKMYADPRACSINDIVTIRISETSTASNKAALTTSKKTQVQMGIDNFLGLEKDMGNKVSDNFDNTSMVGATTNNSNQGEGESKRETTLSAYISARVIDVMPNGNLVIEAKKEVLVNKEKQIAVLSGIIRPRDISYDNIVESNKIADMQIKFSGKGPVSAQAKQGWLSWLIGVIWPF
jgi:flagellar L-ring protein precursor FlgH